MEFAHIAGQVMTMAEKAFSPAGCPGLLASVNAGAIHAFQSILVTITGYLRLGGTEKVY